MDLKEYNELKKKLDEARQTSGKEMVLKAFTAAFEAAPDLLAIRWRQYTPYFNDGNPCYFRTGEPYFRFATMPEDSGDYEDGFGNPEQGTPEDLQANAAWAHLNIPDELYEEAFGDHVKVTVSRDGTYEVVEYSHS